MKLWQRHRAHIGLLCLGLLSCPVWAGPADGDQPVLDGTAGPAARGPVKADARFVPASERLDLNLLQVPQVILPAFDVSDLLADDDARWLNGDRTMRTGIVLPLNVAEAEGLWLDDGKGGLLWVADVGSETALGLRIHLTRMNLPPLATLSAQSLTDRQVLSGPLSGKGDLDSGEVWTESLRGGAARIEYHLPAEALEALKAAGGNINNPGLPFRVEELVHMYVIPGEARADRGETEPCHVDINCVAAWNDSKAATGRINFVKNGGNFLCTGELLNSQSGDFTPYFMTANHCFDTQASATSAEIVWNWWKNGCNGANPDYFTRPRSRVATLLATNATSDFTFIMVEGALPAIRYWMGWDANNVPNNSYGQAVHHPGGGVLRYSDGVANYSLVCSANSHFRTNYYTAPTEPGSSGSGWYDAAQRFRGQLHCGFSFCGAALDDGDDWGHFAVTYPNISGLLATGSDDGTENNDTCASAWPLGTGFVGGRVLRYSDPDWFSVTVNTGQRIIVTVSFEHDYGDIDVQMFNFCGGSLVASSTSVTDTETLDWSNYGGSTSVRINPFLYTGGSYPDTRNQYSINVQILTAPPVNDTCFSATTIAGIPYSASVDNSSANSDGPPGSCNSAGAPTMDNSVWYVWTAPATLQATWTSTAAYDGIVAVFTGSCFGLSEVACGDIPESVTFNATAGTTYYLAVGDWGVTDGGGPTTVSLTTRFPNDACTGATEIPSVPYSTSINTSLAQADGPGAACDFCGTSVMQNDVWYRWTPTEDCNATMTLNAPGYDSVMNIWAGACGDLSNVACFDDPQPYLYTFTARKGVTYFFQFGDYCVTPGGGPTDFSLTCTALNDECSDAFDLPCNGYAESDLTLGTTSPSDPLFSCRFFGPGQGTNSRWYSFEATSTQARLTTGVIAGSPDSPDTLLAVYEGTCGNLVEIACNDDANGTLLSQVDVGGLIPGNTYYVQLAAWAPYAIGSYSLTLECPGNCASCPEGAVQEAEACGEIDNDGCIQGPFAFEPLAINTTVCGTLNAGSAFANPNGYGLDTDWYVFDIATDSVVSWCVTAQSNVYIALLAYDYCSSSTIYDLVFVDSCSGGCVSASLPAGTYVAYVAPNSFTGYPCGLLSAYTATLNATSLCCPGDANTSGRVNFDDMTTVLANFGNVYEISAPQQQGDANCDGRVNFDDMTTVLANFGNVCEQILTR